MFKCPLCQEDTIKQDTLRTYGVDCGKDFEHTYIWKCEECPFIGLEYYIPENAETLFYEMRYQEKQKEKEHVQYFKIKCCNCDRLFVNDDDLEKIKVGDETINACPKCKTDECLKDL